MKREGAVFLDRDGTINEEGGYLDSQAKLALFPQAFAAIEKINKSGMKAVVVTNQSGVARGYFTEEFVSEVHLRIQEILGEGGRVSMPSTIVPTTPRKGGRTTGNSATAVSRKQGCSFRRRRI
ncbi:MAG: HAD-IIIA family hydrolase [Syntrophales bacterium]|nr:HAD-IIIA family hydrolase [Syntrophales bacterium]